MRLDKWLANMGCGSRKDVKKALKSGTVTVNGEVVKDGKAQVDPQSDQVRYQGAKVVYKKEIYLLMNKPPGVISATRDDKQRTVIDLLQPEDQVLDVFPVGRLDKDTEGLLVLTSDGKLAHELLSPKKQVPKTYFARIRGEVDQEDVQAFQNGVLLDDGYQTLPAALHIKDIRTEPLENNKLLGDDFREKEEAGKSMDHRESNLAGETKQSTEKFVVSEVELTITEGKFHQVKRMFAARGKQVLYLKRVGMGGLTLDRHLKCGEYRELDEQDLQALQSE